MRDITKHIQSLTTFRLNLEDRPNRCPTFRKKDKLKHLLFGHKPHIYRVIFRVLEKSKHVEVLHVRNGGRRRSGKSTLLTAR